MGGCNLGFFILFTPLDFPRVKKKRKKKSSDLVSRYFSPLGVPGSRILIIDSSSMGQHGVCQLVSSRPCPLTECIVQIYQNDHFGRSCFILNPGVHITCDQSADSPHPSSVHRMFDWLGFEKTHSTRKQQS